MVKQGQLSENIVSSLGLNLQVLLKDKFSESYLNKVLRLIFENADIGNSLNRILPQDTVICQYNIRHNSPPVINDFLEYKKALESKFKRKPFLIMLEIMPAVSTVKSSEISIKPEVLFRLLELLVACIKNGAQIIKFEKPDFKRKDLAAKISSKIPLQRLIAIVISEISPSVLILTDMKQIQNNQLIKYLSRRVF